MLDLRECRNDEAKWECEKEETREFRESRKSRHVLLRTTFANSSLSSRDSLMLIHTFSRMASIGILFLFLHDNPARRKGGKRIYRQLGQGRDGDIVYMRGLSSFRGDSRRERKGMKEVRKGGFRQAKEGVEMIQ